MVAVDESTGLPELPEGHFWRITREFVSEYLLVQIRRKRMFGSKVVAWSVVGKSTASTREVLGAAHHAMSEFRVGDAWKKFPGDYPPKRLEA